MSIGGWDNVPAVQEQRVRIVTCDPSTSRIEGVLKDGAIVQIAVWETPSLFVWPREGETWTIQRSGLYWMLGSLLEDESEPHPIGDLQPGEAKIASDSVRDRSDRQFVAVDVTGAASGEAVVREGDHWTTSLIAPSGGATPREYTQVAAVNPWVVHHGLGRPPVGIETYDSYGVKIEGDVVQTDSNTITISFSGAMSGSVTYL